MAENKPPALKIVVNGQEREISFEELALSNNLAQEALVRLLVQKNIIEPKELMEQMEQVRKERYRMFSEGDKSSGGQEG
ncbi:MAG: hypothetical protein GY841_05035 [FCB group bacterium]|nr:hypothetical protein [FCB group bacterium]